MRYPILVMAAIIERNKKFLITQRPDDCRHNAIVGNFLAEN